MSKQQIHVELLLGEKVFALNGVSIGRLEGYGLKLTKGTVL